MLKILFMGTPDFAVESLDALYNYGHHIVGVVTTPDKQKGRGLKVLHTPVKEYALEKRLKLFQPEKIKNNQGFINDIKELNPDIICVVSYGKLLSKEVLEIPKKGCINVHPSLLPKYRGSAPIQWAILNGDNKTGVTTIYMDTTMDTGDIILVEEMDINEDETSGELWARASKMGAELLLQTLKQIEEEVAPRKKQGEDYSIAPMLDKKIAHINWEKQQGKEIKNLVRGLNPFMGAYSVLEGKKIKFWKVDRLNYNKIDEIPNIKTIDPGTVILADDKKGLYIKAKDSVIIVLEIQGENAKKMNINDFLRGNKIEVNKKFE